VHGGGYFAPHDTNNIFWILDFYLRKQYPGDDGRFASRGALVELFLFIPPTPAQFMAGLGNNLVQVFAT
jgi:hypothetical protein